MKTKSVNKKKVEVVYKFCENKSAPIKLQQIYSTIFDEILNETEMEKRKIAGFNSAGDILRSEKYTKRKPLKDWE